MSQGKKKKTTEESPKVITRYEKRMAKRQQAAKEEAKEKKISAVVLALAVVALLGLALFFPIRNYMAIHGTYLRLGGESVSRLEYDYAYNNAKNNYINQYGSLLSYMGLDVNKDLADQQYSEDLTWADFFGQMAVENMRRERALNGLAKEAGYSYDASREVELQKQGLEETAALLEVSLSQYVRQFYGTYATMGRIEPLLSKSVQASAYYKHMQREQVPAGEEIEAYYAENTDSYDVVDYRMEMVSAVLESESPTEEEISKAMEAAKAQAQTGLDTVASEGEAYKAQAKDGMNTLIRDWLFEAGRKAGDTTLVEDTAGRAYYVLAFEKKYRNDAPTHNVRILATDAQTAQELEALYAAGGQSEEDFGALVARHSEDVASLSEGGYYEGLVAANMGNEEMTAWLEASRAAGDVKGFQEEDMAYLLYYVGQGQPEWYYAIQDILSGESMNTLVSQAVEKVEIQTVQGGWKNMAEEISEETAVAETATVETAAETTVESR